MNKRGRPPNEPIDRIVTRFWVAQLKRETAMSSGRAFSTQILKRPDLAQHFAGYESGAHRPQYDKECPLHASNVGLAEDAVPGSARYLVSPVWDVIQNRPVSAARLTQWEARLQTERTWLAERIAILEQSAEADIGIANVAFDHFEAFAYLLHDARRSGDRSAEARIIRSFSHFRSYFAAALGAPEFEHFLLSQFEVWVGEAPTLATLPEQGSEVRTKDVLSRRPEVATPALRFGVAAVAVLLTVILGWADRIPSGQVALVAITLLCCLVVLFDPQGHRRWAAQDIC
jgi:hypothetical protein